LVTNRQFWRLTHDAINDVNMGLYGFVFFIAWSLGTSCSMNRMSPPSINIQPMKRLFSMAQQPLVGQGLPRIEPSWSHSHTPHSVRLLWTSDQPDAEISTWQHTTLTRDLNRIRNRNLSTERL
jgi:hypothetical protein